MKYVSLVLLGLLIAVLAGCGGGGDGGKGDKITELTADLELVQADLKKAQADLATTKGRLTTTQGDLSTTKETLTTTQGDLSKTKETLTTTQGDLSTTKETLTTTQETLTTTQGELAITKETLSTTQSNLATTRETLTTTQETLTTTQETLTTTEASLTDAQSDLKTAKASLTAAQSELAITRTTLETAEASLTTLMAKAGVDTVAALNTELDDYVTLQYKVDALLFQFDVDDIEDLRDKLKTDTGLQAEVNALLTATGQTTLAALEKEYKAYTDLKSDVQAVLTATGKTTLTAAVTEIDRLKKAETSLTNRLNEADKKVQDVQDNLNKQVTIAEANARSFGLLRALQVELRSAASDNADENNPTTQISPGGTPPGGTPPTVAIHNTPSGISVSAGLASTKKGSASPSLSVGGTSLRGTRLSRTEAGGLLEEVVVYTDFKGRRVKLLDYDADKLPGTVSGEVVGTTDNRIITLDGTNVNRKLVYDPNKLTVQPSSSITLASGSVLLTAPTIANTTKTITLKDSSDSNNITTTTHTVQKRDKPRAGVTLSHTTSGESIVYETKKGATVDKVEQKIDPTPDANIRVSFSGSVRGVSGTFSCVGGSGCDFTINTQQKEAGGFQPLSYALTEGAWTFKPTSASTTIPVDDKEYFYFGWWQKTPNLADGDYTFRLLAGGTGYWENTTPRPTTGTARYTGPAVGKYVKKAPLASVSERRYTDGTFTASTVLDVTFDTNASVKGTISEFKDGGKAIEGNWLVELGNITQLSFGATGDTGDATLKINGKAPAESMTANDWQVWFFKDHTTPATASTPRAAAGRFDVGLEDDLLHISGVFGAKVN